MSKRRGYLSRLRRQEGACCAQSIRPISLEPSGSFLDDDMATRVFCLCLCLCVCLYLLFVCLAPSLNDRRKWWWRFSAEALLLGSLGNTRVFFFGRLWRFFFAEMFSSSLYFFWRREKTDAKSKKNTAARFEEPKNNRPPPYPSLTIMSYSRGFFFALPSPFPKNSLPNPSASSAVHFFFLVSWCVCVH